MPYIRVDQTTPLEKIVQLSKIVLLSCNWSTVPFCSSCNFKTMQENREQRIIMFCWKLKGFAVSDFTQILFVKRHVIFLTSNVSASCMFTNVFFRNRKWLRSKYRTYRVYTWTNKLTCNKYDSTKQNSF